MHAWWSKSAPHLTVYKTYSDRRGEAAVDRLADTSDLICFRPADWRMMDGVRVQRMHLTPRWKASQPIRFPRAIATSRQVVASRKNKLVTDGFAKLLDAPRRA